MTRTQTQPFRCETVELDGIRYAIVRESLLRDLCRRAGVEAPGPPRPAERSAEIEVDGQRLAQRLVLRRQRAGLSQAELARRAGVRVETLNRLERGRTTPDFATIRKLVEAMNAAEADVPESGPRRRPPSYPLKKGTGSEPDPPADGQKALLRGACPRFQRTTGSKRCPPR